MSIPSMVESPISPISIPSDVASCTSIIATDMDGTFFGTGLSVPAGTVHAYKRAVSNGVPVIPSTGRSYEGVRDVIGKNGLTDVVALFPGVYLNGGLVYGPGGLEDVVCSHAVEIKHVEVMVKFVRELNAKIMADEKWEEHPFVRDAKAEHGFFAVRDRSLTAVPVVLAAYSGGQLISESTNQLTDGMNQFGEGDVVGVGCMIEYAKRSSIRKLLVVTHSSDLMATFRPELEEMFQTSMELNCAVGRILELGPLDVDKAIALASLMERLCFPLNSVFCLGDGENDINMLKECGYSVAMGNGSDAVKSVANVITKSNDEGGWALAVNALLDLKKAQMNGNSNHGA